MIADDDGPLTGAQREARRKARRAAEGLTQVTVWVHASRRDELRAIAAGMAQPRDVADLSPAVPQD